MTTPEVKDLYVGRGIVTGLVPEFCSTEAKLDGSDAKLRMYIGAAAALAGIIAGSMGRTNAVFALSEAMKSVEGMPDEPR